jgi:catechol 2,3-dioxygenase-like lactoylglutathione lyase family enzyme
MLDHIGFSTPDLQRLRDFYDKALAPLGISCLMEVTAEMTGGDAFLGYGRERPQFWIGTGDRNAPGIHIAFAADDRATSMPSTKQQLRQAGAITARQASGHIITPIIMEPSCSTQTGTISRPSATGPPLSD